MPTTMKTLFQGWWNKHSLSASSQDSEIVDDPRGTEDIFDDESERESNMHINEQRNPARPWVHGLL